jgi:hypothetical protein
VWVELLLALIVEGYREFMEWWQTRAFLRPLRRAPEDASDIASVVGGDPGRASVAARAELVEDSVDAVLGRHAGKHVGVAVGVWWRGEAWTFARGRIDADQLGAPARDTIFEIGSVTKVFTATGLADMVEEGLVTVDDRCSGTCRPGSTFQSGGGRSRSLTSRRRRVGCRGCRPDSSADHSCSAGTRTRASRRPISNRPSRVRG